MKKYIIALAAVAVMASCGNEADTESATTEETTEMTATETAETIDPNAKVDPVCSMVKDDTWTDYSVNGTDTVWFCSSTCKEAFDGNPAKYTKS